MRKTGLFVIIQILVVILFSGCFSNSNVETLQSNIINPNGNTLETRFATPEGYERTEAANDSMTAFLRNYEMKEHASPVLLYNGKEKTNQKAHMAVFNLPIENIDLQQCADSVMRMFAEYYWHTGQRDKIAFHFTDGFLCEYSKWQNGYRVVVGDDATRWEKIAGFDDSYDNFVNYLKTVFSYAGTYSMQEFESEPIAISEVRPGDVVLKGGTPGHVVMVADVCENAEGKKAFLLAQGYMPAQEFHILQNPAHRSDPWYYEEEIVFPLRTAEYTFDNENMIRRLNY